MGGKASSKLFRNIVVEGAGRERWGCSRRWDAAPSRGGETTSHPAPRKKNLKYLFFFFPLSARIQKEIGCKAAEMCPKKKKKAPVRTLPLRGGLSAPGAGGLLQQTAPPKRGFFIATAPLRGEGRRLNEAHPWLCGEIITCQRTNRSRKPSGAGFRPGFSRALPAPRAAAGWGFTGDN